MRAVVPSADNAAEMPNRSPSEPAELERMAVGVDELAQGPSLATWNT
jgi:hypothetical protein